MGLLTLRAGEEEVEGGGKLWTCFPGSVRFCGYSVQHCNYGVTEPAPGPGRTLERISAGLLARLLAILRAVKLEGKLSRVMTFAAHDPFMELRAVDRNQSDSVELDTGDSLHH